MLVQQPCHYLMCFLDKAPVLIVAKFTRAVSAGCFVVVCRTGALQHEDVLVRTDQAAPHHDPDGLPPASSLREQVHGCVHNRVVYGPLGLGSQLWLLTQITKTQSNCNLLEFLLQCNDGVVST